MKRIIHKKRIGGLAQSIRGFTLIETLIAISILMIAVIVPLSIVASALQSSYYARDQITAAYLAQDAIEYIRSLRDSDVAYTNNHSGTPNPLGSWYSLLAASCTNGTGCDVGTLDSGSNESTGDSVTPGALKYDKDTGLYHASWSASGSSSRFTRTVKVSIVRPLQTTEEFQVSVHVGWTGSGAGNKNMDVSESLFNVWQ
ncbi:MAG: prepilin-type N-terminal cleavage/methylation domain-containing protein [Candidatus Pacebacteria bacterium]|nr:prepilin-type N-terminal cleavage/methylation domain-containing protein [Candidatus Paceibacterota bacterium]